jgi:integrase/recombinase XerD
LGLPRRQLLHENPQRGRQGVFERATKFDYLDKNPLDKLDPITVVEVPTLPVTPEEFTLLLASVACLKEKYHRTMTALILLMRWSGLSIMDAACLRRDALRADNRLRTYRKKTGEYVYIKLPQFVADLLRAHGNMPATYFFWNPTRRSAKSQVIAVEHRLASIYDAARITPRGAHRLRDTFAVEFLNSGSDVEDLAMLLGHSNSNTTKKHYMPGVRSRQIKLDAAVDRSLAAQGIHEQTIVRPALPIQLQ